MKMGVNSVLQQSQSDSSSVSRHTTQRLICLVLHKSIKTNKQKKPRKKTRKKNPLRNQQNYIFPVRIILTVLKMEFGLEASIENMREAPSPVSLVFTRWGRSAD